MPRRATKSLSKPRGDKSKTLVIRRKANQTPAQATAELVVEGVSHNVVAAAEFSRHLFGDPDLTELIPPCQQWVRQMVFGV